MKIRIHCGKCKEESLLMANKVMNIKEAKNVVNSINDIIKRHEVHPSHLDFYVFERHDDDQDMKRYVLAALNDRIKKHGRK